MNTDAIRKILLQDWDPLGVGDNPSLADEYDDFIPAICEILNSKCTRDQLVTFLLDIEEKLMGGIFVPEVAKKSAEAGALKLLEMHCAGTRTSLPLDRSCQQREDQIISANNSTCSLWICR